MMEEIKYPINEKDLIQQYKILSNYLNTLSGEELKKFGDKCKLYYKIEGDLKERGLLDLIRKEELIIKLKDL